MANLDALYGFNKPSGWNYPNPAAQGVRRPAPPMPARPMPALPMAPQGMQGFPGYAQTPGVLPGQQPMSGAQLQAAGMPSQPLPAPGSLPVPPNLQPAQGGLPVPPNLQPAQGGLPVPPSYQIAPPPAMHAGIMDGTAPGAHAMMSLRRKINLGDAYGFNKPSGWNYGSG